MNKQEFRNLRQESELSQVQFGQILGITGSMVSSIESGSRPVSKNIQAKLEELFPDPERVGLSFVVFSPKTVQVQADGSVVGMLFAESNGWRFRPCGMADKYGKDKNLFTESIETFLEWWKS